ncbi:uncharacterized protein BXZ73DRAFT_99771 [Epithele typhae]|uniref:uncharacterized protein n=1 Tax=Epithele typhae TaxID=378194 RepID=UPI002007270E|nr:uncharacterized protein BXZ73DRAFT_99771 [Epithele typhae]KAH9939095.1 hypothetical protein BXZ73DRAFT_99771 [Epithele typhae]
MFFNEVWTQKPPGPPSLWRRDAIGRIGHLIVTKVGMCPSQALVKHIGAAPSLILNFVDAAGARPSSYNIEETLRAPYDRAAALRQAGQVMSRSERLEWKHFSVLTESDPRFRDKLRSCKGRLRRCGVRFRSYPLIGEQPNPSAHPDGLPVPFEIVEVTRIGTLAYFNGRTFRFVRDLTPMQRALAEGIVSYTLEHLSPLDFDTISENAFAVTEPSASSKYLLPVPEDERIFMYNIREARELVRRQLGPVKFQTTIPFRQDDFLRVREDQPHTLTALTVPSRRFRDACQPPPAIPPPSIPEIPWHLISAPHVKTANARTNRQRRNAGAPTSTSLTLTARVGPPRKRKDASRTQNDVLVPAGGSTQSVPRSSPPALSPIPDSPLSPIPDSPPSPACAGSSDAPVDPPVAPHTQLEVLARSPTRAGGSTHRAQSTGLHSSLFDFTLPAGGSVAPQDARPPSPAPAGDQDAPPDAPAPAEDPAAAAPAGDLQHHARIARLDFNRHAAQFEDCRVGLLAALAGMAAAGDREAACSGLAFGAGAAAVEPTPLGLRGFESAGALHEYASTAIDDLAMVLRVPGYGRTWADEDSGSEEDVKMES